MSARLIVSFRWHSIETPPSRYLAAAERVRRRCTQAGGRPVVWSADRYGFEFEPQQFRLVLKTVLELLSEANTHAAGISVRDLSADEEARVWGPALVVADALCTAAAPGEVLVDPEIPEVQLGLLASIGTIPMRVQGKRIDGLLLIPGACPLDGFKGTEAFDEELPTQPYSELPAAPARRSQSTARAVLSSMAPPPAVPSGVGPAIPPMRGGSGPALERPELSRRVPPRSSAPAPQSGRDERPSVLEALRSGNPEMMLALATELRTSGGQERLAQRLESMANLARGNIELGLQGLAEAVSVARTTGGPEQCQTAIAYAIGLAQVGQLEQALRETLWGLAKARESADGRGERACCRLAARLAAAAGYPDVASSWRDAAAACSERP